MSLFRDSGVKHIPIRERVDHFPGVSNKKSRSAVPFRKDRLIAFRGRFYFAFFLGSLLGIIYFQNEISCWSCTELPINSLTDVIANGVIIGIFLGILNALFHEAIFKLFKGEFKQSNLVKFIEIIFVKAIDKIILCAVLGLILITFFGLVFSFVLGDFTIINEELFWIISVMILALTVEFVGLFLHAND